MVQKNLGKKNIYENKNSTSERICSHCGNPIYTTRVHFGSPILVSIIKSISFVINFGRKGEIDDGNQK